MEYFLYYVALSYLVGFFLFTYEMNIAIKKEQYYLFKVGLIVLLMSPLTTWHGVIHYAQVAWAKLTKRQPKFWI